MNIKELEKIADSLPTMVSDECKKLIRSYASRVDDKLYIVEVGSWLGACSSHIALGLIDGNKKNPVVIYDHFKCTGQSQIEKAAKAGYKLEKGKSYYSDFCDMLHNFNINFACIQGDIKKIVWNPKNKIGLFVDDASKRKDAFDHTVKTFFNSFIPGKTIVMLLDYFYYESRPGEGFDYQKNWMNKNKDRFEFIQRVGESANAIFLYKG